MTHNSVSMTTDEGGNITIYESPDRHDYAGLVISGCVMSVVGVSADEGIDTAARADINGGGEIAVYLNSAEDVAKFVRVVNDFM